MREKEILLNSFSGGKTSAFMSWWLKNEWHGRFDYEIITVFANTGKEKEKSLIFINECDKEFSLNVVWLESKVWQGERKGTSYSRVSFDDASRKGEPFEEVIKKYGIPNQSYPHCTRELKIAPIHSYMSQRYSNYKTAIGIRADEIDRVNPKYKELNYWYPLIDLGVTKKEINNWWDKMPFTLEIEDYEGNCDFCWKKNLPKLIKIANKDRKTTEWWSEMELKYGYHGPRDRSLTKAPFVFGRGSKSTSDIIKLAEHDLKKPLQFNLFDLLETSCSETCHPF